MLGQEELRNLYRRIRCDYIFPYDLKEEQEEALLHLVNEENVVVVAPTGFGKTDIFVLFPLMMDLIKPHKSGKHVVVVVSPLTALIEDQLASIRRKNVSVMVLKSPSACTEEELKDVKCGNYSVLLVTPEALLGVEFWRENILNNTVYEENCSLIAFDEAHVISKWGKTFRGAYNALEELRACLTQSQMLFLTATLTKKDLKDCLSSLQTDIKEVKIVAKPSDRPNIFLGFLYRKNLDVIQELDWYIKMLRMERTWAPKCIIYVSNLSTAGQIYGEIMYHLKEEAYYGTPSVNTRMVMEYHGESFKEDQERIARSFSGAESCIRLVIATVAFGMGINIPDVTYVVHWGPCPTLLDYWQEVGRAGRDGAESYGLFFALPSMVSGASQDVRKFIQELNHGEVMCIRIYVLSNLQLCDADETHIKELEKRKICQTTEKCRETKSCKCQLCLCCSLCWKRCLCQWKVHSPTKLSTTD